MPDNVIDLRKTKAGNKSIVLNKRAVVLTIGTLLILLALAACTIAYFHWRQNTPKSGAAELKSIEHEVGVLYMLPTNETPVLATVTNKSKISSQFLKLAKNGDKILIYQKNQIAIVYRPSINKIITVAPVSISPLPQADQVP